MTITLSDLDSSFVDSFKNNGAVFASDKVGDKVDDYAFRRFIPPLRPQVLSFSTDQSKEVVFLIQGYNYEGNNPCEILKNTQT